MSARGVALGAVLPGLFLVESVVLKGVQVAAGAGELGVWPWLLACGPDLAFAAAMGVVGAAGFSWLRGWVQGLFAVLYGIWMTYVLLFTAASHVYFLATGAGMSWSAVSYWLHHFRDANAVMASESGGWRALFVFSHVLVAPAVWLVLRLGGVKARLAGWGRLSRAGTAGVLAGTGAALAVGLALPEGEGPAMGLSRCVAWDIVREAVEQELLPEEEVRLAAGERLDGSIEIVREQKVPRLNVVLIMFESLRWSSSDVYVPGLGATPFLAELAKQGVVVDRLYAVVPHTTKAVLPINCGFYPALETEPKEATPGILPKRCLAHVLRSQGYRTAFFQPAANFEKRDQLVSNMGYEVYKGLNDMPQEGYEQTNYFGREERMMLQPSLEWLDAVKGEPFLLTYLTLCTHHNYVAPQSFEHRRFPVEDEDLNNYMNAVRYTDEFLRELFAEFEKRDLMESTLFVIVGDHGEAFGEHGRRQHDLIMWEEGLRPLGMLVARGHLPEGGRVEGVRSVLDVVPTVLDVLGMAAVKGEFVGRSLLAPAEEGRRLYHSCWFERRCLAMREGDVATIFHFDARPMEVYDATRDPMEEHDLAGTGPYGSEYMEARREELLRWLKVVNQQYREWEEELSAGIVSDTEPAVGHRLAARLGDGVELVGYDVEPAQVKAGQDVKLRYVFRCVREMDSDDRFFVHVVQRGQTVNADHVPAFGGWPLDRWEPGKYYVDEHTVHIPGTWVNGEARVCIGIWNRKTGKRYAVEETTGTVDDGRLVVAKVKVKGAGPRPAMGVEERRRKVAQWVSREPPAMAVPLHAVFGGRVELVGADLVRMTTALAGTIEMTYAFHALQDMPSRYKLTVKLVRQDGVTIDGDHEPIGGLYPPRDWQAGEYVTDRHRIHIDMYQCKPGTYEVWVGFRDGNRPAEVESDLPADGQGRVKIGTAVVTKE